MTDWIITLYSLCDEGRIDDAFDVMFDHIDDAFHAGEFDKVSGWIKEIAPARLPPAILVGLLTITWAARDRLEGDQVFRDSIKRTLIDKIGGGERAERLTKFR